VFWNKGSLLTNVTRVLSIVVVLSLFIAIQPMGPVLAENINLENEATTESAYLDAIEEQQDTADIFDAGETGIVADDQSIIESELPDAGDEGEELTSVSDETEAVLSQSVQAFMAEGEITYGEAFEDANFLKCVLDLMLQKFGKTRTEDSLLADDLGDIGDIDELDVSEKGISSLKGIEYFTGLEVLDAHNRDDNPDADHPPLSPELANTLVSIDLSNNLKLCKLIVKYNQLADLDVKCLVNLEELDIEGNNIEDIDLSMNTKLNHLDISYNQLTLIDVSSLVELDFLAVNNNDLESLDLSKNESLITISASYNNLENIDLPISDKLLIIQAPYNYLKKIDVSKNTKLMTLDLEYNLLENLNVEKNFNLMLLIVMYNMMETPEDVVGWENSGLLKLNETFYFDPQGRLLAPSSLVYNGDGTVSWEAVDDVEGYVVRIDGRRVFDGIYIGAVVTTSYDLKNVLSLLGYSPTTQNDQSEMKIEISSAALDNNKNPLEESERSEPLIIDVQMLKAPVISIDEEDGHTIRWESISNAPEEFEFEYVIFIGNAKVGEKIVCSQDDSGVSYDLNNLNLKSDTTISIRAFAALDKMYLSEISKELNYLKEKAPDEKDPDEKDPDEKDPDEKDPDEKEPDETDPDNNKTGDGSSSINVNWDLIQVDNTMPYGTNNKDAFNKKSDQSKVEFPYTITEGTFSVEDGFLPTGTNRIIKVTFTASLGENKGKPVTHDYVVAEVSPKELSPNFISITPSSFIYSKSAIKPTVTVADIPPGSSTSILKDSDYTLAIPDSIDAGTVKVTINATTSGNYRGEVSKTFTILKAEPSGTPIFTKITSDGKTLADANLLPPTGGFKNPVSKIDVPGKLTWDDGNAKIVTGKTAYNWTFTPDDTRNYKILTGRITPYPTGVADDTQDDTSGRLFIDVPLGIWYEEAVTYMYEYSLMNGTSTEQKIFSPNASLSRAMIVTILYRQEGEPDVDGFENPFSDVPEGTWYTNAVKYMAENGIVEGYPDGCFEPNGNITRQELAVILVRYAEFKGMELPSKNEYQGFNDEASIAEYAIDAVQNCYEAGIITGKSDGSIFDPTGEATRAETAAMLFRFLAII